jgi:hypothetical protein
MPHTQSGKRYVQRGDGLPEIGWKNGPPMITVKEEDLAKLLGASVLTYLAVGCREDWCEDCNPIRKAWWDVFNASSRELRLAVASAIADAGLPIMPGFYDEQPLP